MFQNEIVDLQDYLHIIRKRFWMIIVIFVVVVAGVTIKTFRQTPIYQATARILIETKTPNVLEFQEVLPEDTRGDYYQTQYTLLKSSVLAKQVLKKLGMLDQTTQEEPQPKRFSIRKLLTGILELLRLREPPPPPSSEADKAKVHEQRIISSFLKRIIVSPLKHTRLVDVSANFPDREKAALIANTLAETYLEQHLETKLSAAQDAVGWLGEELEVARKKVSESEEALQEYKEQQGIISFEDRQNIVVQELSKLNETLNDVRIKRVESEAEYRQIQEYSTEQLESIPEVVNNRFIQQLKTELSNLESELSVSQKDFRPSQTLQSQITAFQKRIDTEIKRITTSFTTSIKSKYEVALAQEQTLTKMLEEQKREALELGQKAITYKELERELESNQRIYNRLLERVKETGITERLETSNIRIVDRATVPRSPIAPKKKRNIVFAMIVGFLMGSVLAIFLEFLDTRIETPEDVKRCLDMPFLGLIPKISMKNGFFHKTKHAAEMIVVADPQSSASEAYRRLRTSVKSSLLNDHERSPAQGSVLLITSAEPLEGKSCIVANLGIALAQSGTKTLIIDCDFRKPVMHKIFSVSNKIGFTNMITNNTNGATRVIRRANIENLHVIPCGKIPPNPSELLESPLTRKLIEALRKRYDQILLDSPPLNAVTDPVILSQIADGVIFTIHAGETKRGAAQYARDQLQDADAMILGGVLNKVDIHKNGHYYAYHHTHYYREEGKGEKPSEIPASFNITKPSLENLKPEIPASFNTTKQSLENLKLEGLPDDVLKKLEALENQLIIGEKEFLKILKITLDDEETVRYKSMILRHTEIPPTSFNIIKQSLENLKLEGLPDDVLKKLEVLENQLIIGEKEFLKILKTTLDDEETVRYKSMILRHAEIPPKRSLKKGEASQSEIPPKHSLKKAKTGQYDSLIFLKGSKGEVEEKTKNL